MYLELFSHIGELCKLTTSSTYFDEGPKISFRFDGPDPFIGRDSSAGWMIRFEKAEWKVTKPGGLVCDCHDDHVCAAARFYDCRWGIIDEVFIGERFGLRLTFQSGAIVNAVVAKEANGELQWQLVNPWGTHLRVYGGGGWTLHYAGEVTPAYYASSENPNFSLETAECSPIAN